MIHGSRPRHGLRCGKLARLARFCGLLDFFRFFRRGLPAQHDVLDIGSVCVGILGSASEVQRCDQTIRIDRVGQRLKQLEGAQSALEQLQPLAIGREYAQNRRPLPGHRTEQLEPGTVLEPFGGHDDLERV
jgi:hypothetical protein